MTHTIHQLECPTPVILAELFDPYDPEHETFLLVNGINAILAQVTGDRVYIIVDMTKYEMTLADLVTGMSVALSPFGLLDTSLLMHNRVRMLFVGSGSMANVLVSSVRGDMDGNRLAHRFTTRDEALAFIAQAQAA